MRSNHLLKIDRGREKTCWSSIDDSVNQSRIQFVVLSSLCREHNVYSEAVLGGLFIARKFVASIETKKWSMHFLFTIAR